jgi:hypothetical protein
MGLADTTVTYNGVTIRNAHTRSFEQENVLDESGTDSLFHRFRISVVGYIHTSPNASSPSKITSTNSAESGAIAIQHQDIRAKLMHNRGEFVMSIGNIDLLRATAQTDVNSGPKPQKVEIIHIAGRSMLRVMFTIEICKVECGSAEVSNESLGVLNNRWSIHEDIDQNCYSVRTIRGRLRVASISLNPQAFRGWVIPPLQRGFKRERMSFNTSPTGLELEYEIQDRQVWAAAPKPAWTWAASHVESTNDGVNSFGAVSVRVDGSPGVDKRELVALAAKICEARLRLNEPEGNFLLEGVEITDPLNESSIEMRVRIRHIRKIESYFGMIGELMGKPLDSADLGDDYDQFASPVPTSSDLASPTGLFICYLQSPCSQEHSIQQVTDPPPEEDYGGETGDGETEIVETTGSLGKYVPSWSEESAQHLYTYYQLENHYLDDSLRIQLPVAQFSNTSEGLDATSAVVRLGAGVAQRLIIVDAERANQWPNLPAITDFTDRAGIENKLLLNRIVPLAPRLGSDGRTFVYGIRGAYLFAMKRRPTPNEFDGSVMPYIDSDAAATGAPLTSGAFSL